ncbi:hypothetical protein F7731_00105 [Cytobacillus depressus]|uniref:Uncharacterized protein n=1 Tax=Cytobacillus depressus TaxID=1602942 RepID=A0A6L3VB76_9BACI|nr:hypothetical protein [Cytobacillus depressus]KAB2338023.1 hypothetical protein F7731_00105 [Cytobacillus depressus]
MSSYKEFLKEKGKIDELIETGYKITSVHENLSGAFVEFERTTKDSSVANQKVKLHILTADARKYFSNIIIADQIKLV